jgi:SAM-dependent methyltransferase
VLPSGAVTWAKPAFAYLRLLGPANGNLLAPRHLPRVNGRVIRMELHRDIAEHYAQGVERDRLETWGRLEAARTGELLRRFLPPSPADVLDVGGAEGAYALPLARDGYRVRLIDPVPRHVEAARAGSMAQPAAPLVGADIGDARDLGNVADDGSADTVLLLGPLYHLTESEDRASALAEAKRVLRSGGVLLAAAISRFASALDGLRTQAIHDPTFESIVKADLRTGVHRNPDVASKPEWFTLAYFHYPDELGRELVRAGFTDVRVLAVEGPVQIADSDLDDPDRRATVLRTIERIEAEPSVLGASQHLMAVATAP